ncbi:hypothetical protein GL307_32635 [Nocardia seriolae]|uniref:hypothetical protein n=1 Tax=Nocardia seriolae TaxID=37332 RepID=UPI0012BC6229|nr:hypothetical protein [Nocardia seriolae]MTL16128.1 hypothetical protein [Nocardia seriolae]
MLGGVRQQVLIEADFDNAAHEAQQKDAQISADGKPLPLVITGDPDSPAATDARQAQQDNVETYAAAIRLARGFRLQAAKAIGDIVKPIVPTGHVADFSRDKRVTLADWNTAHDAYAAKAEPMPFDDPVGLGHIDAVRDLKDLETELAAAENGKGELPLSNALNAKVGDVDKFLSELEKLAPESLSFFMGEILFSARAYDYGAAAIGLGAGAAWRVGITAGAAALSVTAPARVWPWPVVVGVGDVAFEGFHEHWAEDIHDRGGVV